MVGKALVEHGQPERQQVMVDQRFDLVESVDTDGDDRTLPVEKDVNERANQERSIEVWNKVSCGLSQFSEYLRTVFTCYSV